MALTKDARNKLYALVQAAKRLLIGEVEAQLQQFYGIRPDGTVLMVEQLTTRETAQLYKARLLRDRLAYLTTNLADPKNRERAAVQQLVREQAFTILNRFASLRMAEERGIIQETVRQGTNSEGFQVYDSVTGGATSGDLFLRYTWYLNAIFDELAVDLPAVFDRYSPYALLFPTEPTLLKLLDLLNSEDITAHREVGRPALNLWRQDETIGWMYQYYNSRDEISVMREASAPRNSRELAVRNQFFTPRYVVQFLTDNTLGRIWFDMTGGKTALADQCRFMIKEGELKPQPLKDPRQIRMLDPACGSMHFGLYAFDLFEVIYQEAWDLFPELLGDLRDQYTRDEFVRLIPGLILQYNIHGVDIDPRALQMAGLSLWLRAQRSYDDLGLAAADRPAITKGNLVLAEAMPGNPKLLSEIVKPLSKPMRRLVMHLWQRMQLAGELGVVLRIEHEIQQELSVIARDLEANIIRLTQTSLGDTDAQLEEAEWAAQFTDPTKREQFFETAEHEVLLHLRELAETATDSRDGGPNAYQTLLFADDSARGFAFIELCRQRYDVVVMNPPFGATSVSTKAYVDSTYPDGKNDLAAVFVERMHEMLTNTGLLGAISTRTIFFLGHYEKWRQRYIINHTYLKYMADLGGGVLDAMVETSAYVMSREDNATSIFLRVTKPMADLKEANLIHSMKTGENRFEQQTSRFSVISNEPLSYWVDEKVLKLFEHSPQFEKGEVRTAKQGPATSDNFRFLSNYWEINSTIRHLNWPSFLLGDYSLRFFNDTRAVINFKNNGQEVKALAETLYKQYSRTIKSESYYFKPGISWGFRTARFEPHIIPENAIFSHGRFLAVCENKHQILFTCALWNSEYYDYLLKLSMEWITRPLFKNGTVGKLPFPILSNSLQIFLLEQTQFNNKIIQSVFEREETSLYFAQPALQPTQSLTESIAGVRAQFAQNKAAHITSLAAINEQVYGHFGITAEEQRHIREIINNDEARAEGAVFNVLEKELVEGVFSWLLGVAFGRWDVRLARHPDWLPVKENLFSPLPAYSAATLVGAGETSPTPATSHNIVSDAWLQARQIIENTHVSVPQPTIDATAYPVPVRWDGIAVVEDGHPADLLPLLRATLRYLYDGQAGPSADDIEKELASLLGVDELADWLNHPNRFFASHLAQYTQNKRTAPIYWPLSVPSGRYTVWVYYPRLNDQTLYRIVSDFVKPKRTALTEDIRRLEASTLTDKDRRLLTDQQNLWAELEQMEIDLLRIAELPYQPNHDDGVLITAAPLHSFFRNRKWQQATETCWQELQDGKYDWAHLTLPIWPERVREKCKTDLSLAIAHDLESICAVKPKEKKERVKKEKPTKVGQLGINGLF